MKKILVIILMIVCVFAYGQTAEEYFKKAFDYGESGEHQLAIDNFTKSLRIDPDDALAYYNRGWNYDELGNHEEAIADFTRAIRIDPDYASAYQNRGITKQYAGLPYCSDYKRACNLGKEECCEWYEEDQCR